MARTFPTVLALGLLVVASVGASAVVVAGDGAKRAGLTAQEAPGETWNRTYDAGGDERFSSITPTDDGGYLLTGSVSGEETIDAWVVKIDETGDVEWERTLGGPGVDKLYAAVPADGGYVLAGRTDTVEGPRGWLLTVSDGGDVERNRTVGGSNGALKAATAVDGDLLFAGWASGDDGRDGWAVRTDSSGETVWTETYDAAAEGSNEEVKSVAAADGTVLLAGVSESDDGERGWAALVNEDGRAQWERIYGDQPGLFWAAAPAESGFVLAGETGGADVTDRDAWVVGVGSDGQANWARTYGGEQYDWFDSATRTADGHLFTGGTLTGDYGGADGFVVGTGADGGVKWRTTVGSGGWDKPWPTVAAHGDGYLLAGETTGFDSNGKDGWVVRLGASKPVDTFASPTPTNDGTGEADGSDDSLTQLPDETPGAGAVPGQSMPGFTALVALAGLALALFAVVRRRK